MDDSSVRLAYLEQIHRAYLAAGRGANRYLLLNLLITLVLLGLAFGSVTTTGTLGFGSINLRISRAVLLCGLQYLVTMTFAHGWALAIQETELGKTIRAVYGELGFSHPTLADPEARPFGTPNFAASLAKRFTDVNRSGKIAGQVARILFAAFSLIFPVLTEITVFLRGARSDSPVWLLILYAVPIPLLLAYVGVAWHWARRAA